LICFPCAGGGASIFRAWQKELAGLVEVRAVQYPGHEGRAAEPFAVNIEQLAESVFLEIAPTLNRPFMLFGHSMGAWVAQEVARCALRAGSVTPSALLIAGQQAPNVPLVRPRLSHLPDSEFLNQLHELSGTAHAPNSQELLDYLLPALRSDFALLDAYRWQNPAPMNLPLRIFGGRSDRYNPHTSMTPWSSLSTSPCSVQMLAGGHFFITEMRSEFLKLLAFHLETLWSEDS
jgi:medium-chain acyl-[acyl-carrier-protein] hydrolase